MILIASASARVRWDWREGLARLGPVTAVDGLTALIEVLALRIPRVLLVDAKLAGPDEVAELRTLCPVTRIVILSDPLSEDAEVALFMSGARGCCRYDAEPELRERLVKAVERGEVWLRRSISSRLLDELDSRTRSDAHAKRLAADRLSELTRREREIAVLIGAGRANKQIARELQITERTVKSHLTEIFRKLGIADRLKLALRVTGHLQSERERTADRPSGALLQ